MLGEEGGRILVSKNILVLVVENKNARGFRFGVSGRNLFLFHKVHRETLNELDIPTVVFLQSVVGFLLIKFVEIVNNFILSIKNKIRSQDIAQFQGFTGAGNADDMYKIWII